ncbi:RPGF6 factor, partial [Acromyrmex heyeri]
MTDYLDPHFVRALCRDPERRTLQDLQIIYYGLLGLEALRPCRDSVLRGLCKIVRYERHHANHVLYYTGELATSWYILLSGSVFIDGSMFLPRSRDCLSGRYTLVHDGCSSLRCRTITTTTTTTTTTRTTETRPTARASTIIREAHTARFQQINLSATVLMRRFLVLPSVPSRFSLGPCNDRPDARLTRRRSSVSARSQRISEGRKF